MDGLVKTLVSVNQAKKAKSAASTAEDIMQGRERGQLSLVEQESQAVKDAATQSRKNMLEAGQATPEETSRLSRYSGKAQTPGETLMTESGPIAQAVARRVQERVDQPGLDYNTNSNAFAQGVGEPLWRSLKARGIAAPPGSEGGGLGTQQYMKGAEPALAELRSNQINTDISRGEDYGTRANSLQNVYTQLENSLAEAIRTRLYNSGISGAAAEQSGLTAGSQLKVGGSQNAVNNSGLNDMYSNRESNARANKDSYDSATIASLDDMLNAITSALTMGAGGAMGSVGLANSLDSATKKSMPQGNLSVGGTPYENQLNQISLANALKRSQGY